MSLSTETVETILFWSLIAYMLGVYLYLLRETLRLSKLSKSSTRFTRMLSTPFWRTEDIKRELEGNELLRTNADKTERKMYLLGGIGALLLIASVLFPRFMH
jgi:hypothetical protein